MAMLVRLKEDLLFHTDSDDDRESASGLNDTVDVSAALNDKLDLSDTHTNTKVAEKSTSHPDSGSKDDILESLTQAFVHTKEKSPAIAEKIAGLIDNVVTVGHSPNMVKDKLRNILLTSFVKDLYSGKTTNKRQILDHVMDSTALLANANFKLNMKQQELIKADLNPPIFMLWFNFILGLIFISFCFKLIIIHYHAQKQWKIKIKPRIKLNNNMYTRLCKDEIKPSTKFSGDNLSKHVKDMAEAKNGGRQMQNTSETQIASQGYFKAGQQKFHCPNFKPHERSSSQKTFSAVSFFRLQLGAEECPEKAQSIH